MPNSTAPKHRHQYVCGNIFQTPDFANPLSINNIISSVINVHIMPK